MFPFGDVLSPVGPVSSICDKTDLRNNMVNLFVLRQEILSQIRPHVANSLLSELFGLCSYGKSSIAHRSVIRHTHG